MLHSMLLSVLSVSAHGYCEPATSWVDGSVARAAIDNVSSSAFERQFMGTQLYGYDGSFECDAFGDICNVMAAAQAESAILDVLAKADAGWSTSNLSTLLALHIQTANPSGAADPGFTMVGPNIAVGWGGASGALTEEYWHTFSFDYGNPAAPFTFGYRPNGSDDNDDMEEIATFYIPAAIALLLSCPKPVEPGSFGDEKRREDSEEGPSDDGECEEEVGDDPECPSE